jgi:hypothetical protein
MGISGFVGIVVLASRLQPTVQCVATHWLIQKSLITTQRRKNIPKKLKSSWSV